MNPKKWAAIPSSQKNSVRKRTLVLAVGAITCIAFWQIPSHSARETPPTESSSRLPSEQDLLLALQACQKQSHGLLSSEAELNHPGGAASIPLSSANNGQDGKNSYVASFEQTTGPSLGVPDQTNCSMLDETSEFLPDFVHIPIEAAVSEDTLIGWEDDWIAHGIYNVDSWGTFDEPKIDFVYLWVNGSDDGFQEMKRPYELASSLNDPKGMWLQSHGVNRYRDWDELRYSVRSVAKYAKSFRNKIQLLVNGRRGVQHAKQVPEWLKPETDGFLQVLAQEDYFEGNKKECLPTFNSLTMENQIFNTPSDVDRFFALSDDMLLGKMHAASDIYSPLFGPVLGFKTSAWSLMAPPTAADAQRFGEKPYLAYTSWLMNQRFGERKRKGQAHFGHSLSRKVMREALNSFPRPEIKSACRRFRGEPGFQIYSWYIAFHYLIERHREALLWSYVMLRSDTDGDENLSWPERQRIIQELEEGMANEGKTAWRARNFYSLTQTLQDAGLEPPRVNTEVTWTSLDGPATIQDIECMEFDVDTCLAPGFSTSTSDHAFRNPVFSTAAIFDRVARQDTKCGDCLIKLLLNRVRKGLEPLLPPAEKQAKARQTVVKALMRYHYTIVNPDALFLMVTDAEQVDNMVVKPMLKAPNKHENQVGQLCLNDDVAADDDEELEQLRTTMRELYEGLLPEKSPWEM